MNDLKKKDCLIDYKSNKNSGLGTYKHSCGYFYEGLFFNGLPSKLDTAYLVIAIENENLESPDEKFKIIEGNQVQKITVKCMNDENEVISEDGRLIQLTLAVKLDISDNTVYENQIVTEL